MFLSFSTVFNAWDKAVNMWIFVEWVDEWIYRPMTLKSLSFAKISLLDSKQMNQMFIAYFYLDSPRVSSDVTCPKLNAFSSPQKPVLTLLTSRHQWITHCSSHFLYFAVIPDSCLIHTHIPLILADSISSYFLTPCPSPLLSYGYGAGLSRFSPAS